MAAATLGSFYLDSWNSEDSPYLLPTAHLELETRAGLDNFNTWNKGTYGNPFAVETVTLFTTKASAIAMKRDYENAIASVGLTLFFEDEVQSYVFKVIDVKVKFRAIVHGRIAGDNSLYIARLDTQWTLAALPFQTEQ